MGRWDAPSPTNARVRIDTKLERVKYHSCGTCFVLRNSMAVVPEDSDMQWTMAAEYAQHMAEEHGVSV